MPFAVEALQTGMSAYVVAAAAALKLRLGSGWAMLILAIGIVYSIAMFASSGVDVLLWSAAIAVAGLPIRFISRRLNATSRAVEANPAALPE